MKRLRERGSILLSFSSLSFVHDLIATGAISAAVVPDTPCILAIPSQRKPLHLPLARLRRPMDIPAGSMGSAAAAIGHHHCRNLRAFRNSHMSHMIRNEIV